MKQRRRKRGFWEKPAMAKRATTRRTTAGTPSRPASCPDRSSSGAWRCSCPPELCSTHLTFSGVGRGREPQKVVPPPPLSLFVGLFSSLPSFFIPVFVYFDGSLNSSKRENVSSVLLSPLTSCDHVWDQTFGCEDLSCSSLSCWKLNSSSFCFLSSGVHPGLLHPETSANRFLLLHIVSIS